MIIFIQFIVLRLNMYNFNLQRIQERNDIKKNMLVI